MQRRLGPWRRSQDTGLVGGRSDPPGRCQRHRPEDRDTEPATVTKTQAGGATLAPPWCPGARQQPRNPGCSGPDQVPPPQGALVDQPQVRPGNRHSCYRPSCSGVRGDYRFLAVSPAH